MFERVLDPNRGYDVMLDKEICELAYRYWEERGRPFGSPEVDWYRAVADVNREHAQHATWNWPDAI
jgi:hypothetical protein